MAIPDDRWEVVAPTQFPHEQEAFDFIKQHALNVIYAWSNFEFIEPGGKIYEVDLMLLTLTDLFLVEIKSWSGILDGSMNNLIRYTRGNPNPRSVSNPIKLTNHKAKVLKSMIADQKDMRNVRVPFIKPILFFNNHNLELRIPADKRPNVYYRRELVEGLQPKQEDLQNPHKRIDKRGVRALGKALRNLGIRAPRKRTLKVGEWIIEELLEEGDLYQDHKAQHQSTATFRRVRVFSVPLEGSVEQRNLAKRAAEREYKLTDTLRHPGILKPLQLLDTELGPALVYHYEPKAERLDHYLTARDSQLGLEERAELLRQLADVLRYTHTRRVCHRGLAPQSIMVTTRLGRPELQVMDWQTGMEQDVTSGTSHIGDLMLAGAKAYLAPEAFHEPSKALGELVDVFGWGAVAFHVLTGAPPAETHLDLYQKLQKHPGLLLSSVTDGLSADLEGLVESCTHPLPHKRPSSIQEVLELLEDALVEKAQEETGLTNPLEARAGDLLAGGFSVLRRLGKGAMALALEVERDGVKGVLKVAHAADSARDMEREAEALKALDHPHIVKYFSTEEIGNRTCLFIESAGSETLAYRLSERGPLQLDMLERWGSDLLKALAHLEEKGIRHRDIKPANLGVVKMGKSDALHLMLFDFSLAGTEDTNISAGTREYLDPFLQNKRPPRWDPSAERYSAGVTLHEMATNTLPRWGDGTTHPGLDPEVELVLEAERFDPSLRERLSTFFNKALDREREKRFHNAEEMLKAWTEIFKERAVTPEQEEQELHDLDTLLEQSTWQTTLASLGLEVRLLRAFERLDVHTIGQLIQLPSGSLHTASGVGNRTRKRLVELQSYLADWFEEDLMASLEEGEVKGEDQGLLEAFLVPVLESGRKAEEDTKKVYLGLGLAADEMPWPTLVRVCDLRGLDRMKLAKRVPGWRRAWGQLASLKFLRDELVQLLDENGGLATTSEVALGLLCRHGSFSNDRTRRMQLAGALARAAVEAEQTSVQPRFLWERIGTQPIISRSQEETQYVKRLAEIADRCSQQEPLLSPARVAEEIQAVPKPDKAETITPHRLLRLAAACSRGAAVSTREEFYPRGMAAARALVLAHGALLGQQILAPEEIRNRVLTRYPESQPLPGRPELDSVLKEVDPDLYWDESEVAYRRRLTLLLSTAGSSPHHRFPTTDGTRASGYNPVAAEARRFEERLQQGLKNEDFLVLMAEAHRVKDAEEELTHRFELVCRDVNTMLLKAMRQKVEEKGGKWEKFLEADSKESDRGWMVLTSHLVPDAMTLVEEQLLSCKQPQLLLNTSLLGRYDQLSILEKMRDLAGARDGLSSVWVLLPSEDTSRPPMIDGRAVPLIHGGQKARIPDAWLSNAHRAAPEKLGA